MRSFYVVEMRTTRPSTGQKHSLDAKTGKTIGEKVIKNWILAPLGLSLSLSSHKMTENWCSLYGAGEFSIVEVVLVRGEKALGP